MHNHAVWHSLHWQLAPALGAVKSPFLGQYLSTHKQAMYFINYFSTISLRYVILHIDSFIQLSPCSWAYYPSCNIYFGFRSLTFGRNSDTFWGVSRLPVLPLYQPDRLDISFWWPLVWMTVLDLACCCDQYNDSKQLGSGKGLSQPIIQRNQGSNSRLPGTNIMEDGFLQYRYKCFVKAISLAFQAKIEGDSGEASIIFLWLPTLYPALWSPLKHNYSYQ